MFLHCSFHSLLLFGGLLNNLRLSFITRWTVNNTSVFHIGAWVVAGIGNTAIFSADFWTFEFGLAFGSFHTITTYTITSLADWGTIWINGKVVFIDRWFSAFIVKVDKKCYIFTFALLIIRHSIMGRIQKKLWYFVVKKKIFHLKESVQKAMGVMFRRIRKMRKQWQATL